MAAAPARTYVDFAPPHSVQEDPDKLSLRVDLSAQGFKKEQIRVQIDNFGRLRISGERPIGDGSRWRRFVKEFKVPDTCDAAAIRARLDKDGVLLITMPKLSPTAKAAEQPEPEAPAASKGGAAAAAHQGHEPAGHTGAQLADTAAAQGGEERSRQEENAGAADMERPGQQHDEEHPNSDDAAAETAPAARRPAAYGFGKDRRRMLLAIFAAMLALVAAGLFAKYRLTMDPSAETTAPSDNYIVSLSDS
ncbi:unnamed protein product [Urochloa humidicola]